MTSALARKTVASILILAMTAMGLVAAAARGQTVLSGQVVVLCSGGGLVQVRLDETGAPTGDTHLCPDLAFGLLAALEVPPPDVARPMLNATDAPRRVAGVSLHGQTPVVAQARGPPVRI